MVCEGKRHLKPREESGNTIRRRAPRFELIAGNVALDFVNTLDDRPTQPKELLATYADLLDRKSVV